MSGPSFIFPWALISLPNAGRCEGRDGILFA